MNRRHLLKFIVLALLCTMITSGMGTRAKAESEVKLNKTSIVLLVGEQGALSITGSSFGIAWTTQDEHIATVDSLGMVTAVKKGTTKIIATVDGETFSCKVKVVSTPLNKVKMTLERGKKQTLKIKGTTKKVTWSSSKKSVATVSSKGVVTGKKSGTATITAKIGNKKYQCKVTVKELVGLSKNTITLNGTTQTIKVSSAKSLWGLHFTCSNSKIVEAMWIKDWDSGTRELKLIPKKAGKTTIKVYHSDNKKKYKTVKVTVKKAISNKYTREERLAGYGLAFVMKNLEKTNKIQVTKVYAGLDGDFMEDQNGVFIEYKIKNKAGKLETRYITLYLDNCAQTYKIKTKEYGRIGIYKNGTEQPIIYEKVTVNLNKVKAAQKEVKNSYTF